MKKIFTFMMALLLGAGMLYAENEIYAALNSVGDTMTIYYDEQRSTREGVLTTWFWSIGTENVPQTTREAITTVVIDASMVDARPIKTSNWFANLTNLTTVNNLSTLNTENAENMNMMFYKCSKLTALDLSTFNTAKVTSMSYMFKNCWELASLNLNNWNTANVKYMNELFNGCEKLATLDVSGFNTANVTRMDYMFSNCVKLTTLNVSNFNTEKVTDMRDMFAYCRRLTSLDVSNFNTGNVTDMQRMFDNCQLLTSLDVSNFNTANVTSMYAMFENCQLLTSLDVSNFNTANVKSMYAMFAYCLTLTSLDVSNFNIDKVTNTKTMFYGCTRLKTIYCDNDWSASTVLTTSDNMFYGTALVGGKGTTYNASVIDKTYARPDGGTEKPGYFSTKICYIITWKMDDGTIIDQTSVESGVVPTHADPTKPATAQYSYTFAGWTPEVVAATEDATYTATFTSSVNTYDITFELKDDASKSYVAKDVEYGTTLGQLIDQVKAAFGGETYEDDQYIYTFAGLENAQMTDIITESKTYYVLYTKEAKPSTAIDQVNSQELKAKSQKLIRDGQIFILRNSKVYTATGQEVK